MLQKGGKGGFWAFVTTAEHPSLSLSKKMSIEYCFELVLTALRTLLKVTGRQTLTNLLNSFPVTGILPATNMQLAKRVNFLVGS